MIGAIAGDIVGSTYEASGEKNYDFDMFTEWSKYTDDTVTTIAVAKAILEERSYQELILEECRKHPFAGYGQKFEEWIWAPEIGPYQSWGNGSAMRISAIGFAAESEEFVMEQAKKCAEITHNHPEGVKGAQATALCIYLARKGYSKEKIRAAIEQRFEYNLHRTIDQIRPNYSFDVSCQGSVPESIIGFLDADDYESTIRNVISLGGDTDTMACIAGGIAQAFYKGVPQNICEKALSFLPEEYIEVIDRFYAEYNLEL